MGSMGIAMKMGTTMGSMAQTVPAAARAITMGSIAIATRMGATTMGNMGITMQMKSLQAGAGRPPMCLRKRQSGMPYKHFARQRIMGRSFGQRG